MRMFSILAGLLIIVRGAAADPTNLPTITWRSLEYNEATLLVRFPTNTSVTFEQFMASNNVAAAGTVTGLSGRVTSLETATNFPVQGADLLALSNHLASVDAGNTNLMRAYADAAAAAASNNAIAAADARTAAATNALNPVAHTGEADTMQAVTDRSKSIDNKVNMGSVSCYFTNALAWSVVSGGTVGMYAGAPDRTLFLFSPEGLAMLVNNTNVVTFGSAITWWYGNHDFGGNTASNGTFRGIFQGDLSGGTNFNASNIGSGTVPLARLTDIGTAQMSAAAHAAYTAGGAYRYQVVASPAGKETWVLASSTNVTAAWVGTGLTLTIPAGTVMSRVAVHWDASSYGTSFTVDVGTNDMVNTSMGNRWAPTVAVYREDTGAYIASAQGALVTANHAQTTVSGLQSLQFNKVMLDY